MAERISGISKALAQGTQFPYSARVSRLEERQSRDAFASAAQRSEKPSAVDQCARQFKHSLNGNGGIYSLCLRCGVVVASVDDEWCLLEHERRHVCSHAH
jgi:hypothetical protein